MYIYIYIYIFIYIHIYTYCRFKLIPKSVSTKSTDGMVIELFVTKLFLFSYFIAT